METRYPSIISPLGVLANRFGLRANRTHIPRVPPTSPTAVSTPTSSRFFDYDSSASLNISINMDGSSRHSMQWPFRGSTHMYSSSSASYNTGRTRSNTAHTHSNSSNFNSTISSFWARRGTFASRGHRHNASSMSDLDIIPDYVVNYIRGETPETLAVKREMRRGPQSVRIHRHSRGFHSRTANFFMSASEESNDAASLAYSEDEKDLEPMGWSAGWRAGALLNLGVLIVLLILIMVAFIAAVSRTSSLVGQSAIFTGSCHSAQNLGYGLHIIVSVIVVAMVVVANYLFQLLSSPTRAEVTVAHEKRQWVDLGIPSIRNLLHISSSRVVCIGVLLLTALAAQVFYNAILYIAHSVGAYNMALLSSDFFTGTPFDVDSVSSANNAGNLSVSALSDLQKNLDDYVNMTVPDCTRAFSASFAPFDVLLLITDAKADAGTLLQTAPAGTQLFGFAQTVSTSAIHVQGHAVSYCLAHMTQAEQTCSVMINSSFVAAAALITLFSTLAVGAIILTMAKFRPLATLGDALNSFLDMPDSSTYDSCLMTKADVRSGHWGLREPKHWNPKDHYWLMTPSLLRWAGWAALWLAPTILAIVALAVGIQNNPLHAMSDFGLPAPNQMFLVASAGASLLVGLPHLLLAALYMGTNALLTTYFLSHELSLFAVASQPRSLRISSGVLRGSQTAGLYLTLPRVWSGVLFLFFVALSFIASQSIFAVSMATSSAPLSAPSATNATAYATAVGISGTGMLALIALLMLLAGLVVGLGLRRADPSPSTVDGFPAGNPLVLRGGSCSAVISARCHSSGQGEVTSRPMAWGVLQEGEGMTVGHAAFSAREVWALNKGRVYA